MTDWTQKRVAIAYGGRGNERAISLKTGAAFQEALVSQGVPARLIDLTPDKVSELIAYRPDVVLIAMHGKDGEDGALQGFLELMGIPYTGSGVAASALAMDKVRSKCVFERFGVPSPAWTRASSEVPGALPMPVPLVVKPALEGSSVGISKVTSAEAWPAAWEVARACSADILVEAFVAGREFTVGVDDNGPMGIIEIRAADVFFDYAAKYERNDTTYEIPDLDEALESTILAAGVAAYRALGCRGVARADVLLDAENRPWVLEVNTIPGMTATSLVPKLAAANGIPFPSFVLQLLESATTDAEVHS